MTRKHGSAPTSGHGGTVLHAQTPTKIPRWTAVTAILHSNNLTRINLIMLFPVLFSSRANDYELTHHKWGAKLVEQMQYLRVKKGRRLTYIADHHRLTTKTGKL